MLKAFSKNKIEVKDLKGLIEVQAIIITESENSSSEKSIKQTLELKTPYSFSDMKINYIKDSYVIEIPKTKK